MRVIPTPNQIFGVITAWQPLNLSILTLISVKRWSWSFEGDLATDGRTGDDCI